MIKTVSNNDLWFTPFLQQSEGGYLYCVFQSAWSLADVNELRIERSGNHKYDEDSTLPKWLILA